MQVTGREEFPEDAPCQKCGSPLVSEEGTDPIELAGFNCLVCAATHVYHVVCLPEDVQVELMLARMQHQGMI